MLVRDTLPPVLPDFYSEIDEETLAPDSTPYQLAAVVVGCQQNALQQLPANLLLIKQAPEVTCVGLGFTLSNPQTQLFR
jgi:hypothetical protein